MPENIYSRDSSSKYMEYGSKIERLMHTIFKKNYKHRPIFKYKTSIIVEKHEIVIMQYPYLQFHYIQQSVHESNE